jgi:hypothetical protein
MKWSVEILNDPHDFRYSLKTESGKTILTYDANSIMCYQGDLLFDLRTIAEAHNHEIEIIENTVHHTQRD